MTYKELLWIYLLKHGTVTNKNNWYFGGYERTIECYKAILNVGIDWSKTNIPYDDIRYEHVDVHSDGHKVSVLRGEICLKNNKKYKLQYEYGEFTENFKIIYEMAQSKDTYTIESTISAILLTMV